VVSDLHPGLHQHRDGGRGLRGAGRTRADDLLITQTPRGVSRRSESALAKLDADDPRLKDATTYSTLEPCSERMSMRPTCVELIIAAGIPRVVIAWREPSLFVDDCIGVECSSRPAGPSWKSPSSLRPPRP